uniref:Reverse transcriptase domain-containing protein n=1 Tax=Globodera pallida TaxID=36090 RepID=A0A183CJZ9_GLOPA
MEPPPQKSTFSSSGTTNKLKVESGKRKADTCSRCLTERAEEAVGHRACDKRCPLFAGGARTLKPERHVIIVSDDEEGAQSATGEEEKEDGEIREPEAPTEPAPEVFEIQLPAVILLESVGKTTRTRARNPPGGPPPSNRFGLATEIIRDTMEEDKTEDALIGIDPRGKQPEGMSVEESQPKEDELRVRTKEARDEAFKTFVATETSLDRAKEKKRALLDEARRQERETGEGRSVQNLRRNRNVVGQGEREEKGTIGRGKTTRERDVGSSANGHWPRRRQRVPPGGARNESASRWKCSPVATPLERFLAGMVLECRRHTEQVTELARRPTEQMEHLLFVYLEATKKVGPGRNDQKRQS